MAWIHVLCIQKPWLIRGCRGGHCFVWGASWGSPVVAADRPRLSWLVACWQPAVGMRAGVLRFWVLGSGVRGACILVLTTSSTSSRLATWAIWRFLFIDDRMFCCLYSSVCLSG
ncbi:hypothetical protein BO70DRAFT_132602 [Aspergillus heteromorphus CBS 117.55]|uniref:Uncharacterized protein n=1 Tax=Aspergillus heteromorphus CBS 117.55 TaxID=1448321 RepID=A0A317WZ45_9EURO|nr:uncharacterized protein BO70DRAFT_132602 [Aspergillus heteromorphus CBS 117.55]PWY90008.1 hypothetical protein BO70DRAFT_132602 [Aspergillus heteromorphus CBS 117.55]